MNRRGVLSMSTVTVLGLALLPASAVSQQKSLKDQLIGSWTLVSQADVQKDGSKVAHFGPNPKGMLLFDDHGRFSLIIVRSDLAKFAGQTVGQGTADEYKAVMQGMVANFGTYSVDEAAKTLTTRQEGSWFPNLVGVDQKRIIASLTADELKYTNPTAATGATAEVVWKRVK